MKITDILIKDIISLNKKVEDFLVHWRKEVSIPEASFLILITALLISLNGVVSSYNGDLELISMAIKLAPQTVIETFQTWGIVGTICWYIPAFIIWLFGKLAKGKKRQPTASQIFYSYSIFLFVLFLTSTIFSISSAPISRISAPTHLVLLVLGYLFLAAIAYLEIMVLKVLIGPSIPEIVTGWIGAGFIGFLLIVAIIILSNLSQNNLEHNSNEVSLNVSVINQSDGSFTIDYNETTLAWNKVSERYCLITFPSGWQTISEEEFMSKYQKYYGVYHGNVNSYRMIYKKSLWNSSTPEFVFINHLPPEDGGNKLFSWQEDTYESALNGILITNNDGFIFNNASLSKNSEIGAETLDIFEVAKNQTQARHKVSISFVDFIQMEFDYQSPNKKDSDFYFILNSIRCSNS